MDTFERAIELMYRRIPVEMIERDLKEYCFPGKSEKPSFESKELFIRYAETTFSGYSMEEQELFYMLLKEERDRINDQGNRIPISLSTVFKTARDLLDIQNNQPVCRSERVDEWRKAYYLVGQDLLVCAFLAEKDIKSSYIRCDFGWLPTVKTDHIRLNRILEKGIAENHRHLNGSTQLFEISWIYVMNYPYDRLAKLEKMNASLQGMFVRENADISMTMAQKVELAALLRTILFRQVINNFCECDSSIEMYRKEYLSQLEHSQKIKNIISCLRYGYAAEILTPEGHKVILDYALRPEQECRADPYYRCLAGERWLLYSCFQASLRGKLSSIDHTILYLYLVIKTSFRGELIQVNKQTGFHNFMEYQTRKDFFWEDTPYEWEAYRMAINGPLARQRIESMESRIAPKMTPKDFQEKIEKLDMAVCFAEKKDPYLDLHLNSIRKEAIIRGRDAKDFYVVHFIKSDDIPASNLPEFELYCRHQSVRNRIEKEAVALAMTLSRSEDLCKRIRGIDACNLELNCRPEVFAQAYRFLSGFHAGMFFHDPGMESLPVAKLSKTYHVGEDFYSIPDGLRAIDEAIRFLELKQGDRLGHALALGVDPFIHNVCKSNYTVIPKQNYLDMLVWILYRGIELDIEISPALREKYKQEASKLFREIYAETGSSYKVDLDGYYESMRLRADQPECYKRMRFDASHIGESPWESFAISEDIELNALRQVQEIVELYYAYQYDRQAKIAGERPIQFEVQKRDLALYRELQEAMIQQVNQKGLYIETNPTSNVLIGTFKEYKYHPIFRFNNGILGNIEQKYQLNVCVNTDDLGVFDTSLDFEYALLFKTLDKEMDENGCKKYSEEKIIAYINHIREIGIEAVFK